MRIEKISFAQPFGAEAFAQSFGAVKSMRNLNPLFDFDSVFLCVAQRRARARGEPRPDLVSLWEEGRLGK